MMWKLHSANLDAQEFHVVGQHDAHSPRTLGNALAALSATISTAHLDALDHGIAWKQEKSIIAYCAQNSRACCAQLTKYLI